MKRTQWCICLILLLFAMEKAAFGASVTAALPEYPVYLNGVECYANAYSEYPIICYQDVTYFPMTWYHCRMLGLETTWDAQHGLRVERNDAMTSSMGYYSRQQRNPQVIQAAIAAFPIQIGEERIDNSKEAYPLLVFRDVTYFPLTWRFAQNTFGWEYVFDAQNGLMITSHNPQIEYMPVLHGRTAKTAIRLLDQRYYYISTSTDYEAAARTSDYWYHTEYLKQWEQNENVTGILRAPWDNSSHAQMIHVFDTPPVFIDFVMLDEKPYIVYRRKYGEALQALQVHENGTCQPAAIVLSDYINGTSRGNQQQQWTYEIRDQFLQRTMDGENWNVFSKLTASWYGLLGGNIFYLHPVDKENGNLYFSSGEKGEQRLTKEKVREATLSGEYVICLLEASEDYGAKIFDATGALKLAVPGAVDMISIGGHTVMVVTNEKNALEDRIKLIHLM